MAKTNNLVDFYQKIIKPETRQMIEEVLEEKLDQKFEEKFEEHLGPIKAAIISLEKSVSFALGDYKGQQMQVSDQERRIGVLENKVLHS